MTVCRRDCRRGSQDALVIGDVDNRLPNTLNMAFEYLESEAILLLLDRQG